MSRAMVKMGRAAPTSKANKALRSRSCQGFFRLSDGTSEHPEQLPHGDEEQDCPGHILHHFEGLGDEGKYPSMASMSVPRASKNTRDTASISSEAMLETQVTIPQKSNRASSPPLASGVLAAGDQGLQVGHDESQSVQDDPGDHNALEPAGGLIHSPLVPGHHADDQGNGATVTATMVLMATTCP